MRFPILILAVVASAVLVSASRFAEDANGVSRLSAEDITRIGELIAEGDDPEALAHFLGDAHFNVSDLDAALSEMARLERIESLRTVLPHIVYPEGSRNAYLTAFLLDALSGHRPEVCDVILSQDFRFREINAFGVSNSFWCGGVFGLQAGLEWTLPELINLVARHPRFAALIEPLSWEQCPNGARCLQMLEFLGHLTAMDDDLAQLPRVQPNAIINSVRGNAHLTDLEMTIVLQRLNILGGVLDDELLAYFQAWRPNHFLTIGFIQDVVNGFDIKQPEEEEEN